MNASTNEITLISLTVLIAYKSHKQDTTVENSTNNQVIKGDSLYDR